MKTQQIRVRANNGQPLGPEAMRRRREPALSTNKIPHRALRPDLRGALPRIEGGLPVKPGQRALRFRAPDVMNAIPPMSDRSASRRQKSKASGLQRAPAHSMAQELVFRPGIRMWQWQPQIAQYRYSTSPVVLWANQSKRSVPSKTFSHQCNASLVSLPISQVPSQIVRETGTFSDHPS